jgi:uncharacterized heparinase superfamily protein
MSGKLAQLAFANSIYDASLTLPPPRRLRVTPPDPWPGDAARGSDLLGGRYHLRGRTVTIDSDPFIPELPQTAQWLQALHGFAWLQDLRALGGDQARRRARHLCSQWLDHYDRWSEPGWDPVATGHRLHYWLLLHDFFLDNADNDFRLRVYRALMRQARHLSRILPGNLAGKLTVKLTGADAIIALAGWAMAAQCLDPEALHLKTALEQLELSLKTQLLPDACLNERDPERHLLALRALIDLRNSFSVAHEKVPGFLATTISRMTLVLKLWRHGDGALASFQGGNQGDPLIIDTILTQADSRGRSLRALPHGGYHRLTASRTLVIIDCGPPAITLNPHYNAALLAMEISAGRERLIVNCGTDPSDSPLTTSLRCTAAGSTITIANTNALTLTPNKNTTLPQITVQRDTMDGATLFEASHDGWLERFGLIYRRRLYLGITGDDIRGEEYLDGPSGHAFTLRFHLHPSVAVMLAGSGAVLKTAGGAGWRLRIAGGDTGLEESLYLGLDGKPRRSQQITVQGYTTDEVTLIRWSLTRERRIPIGKGEIVPDMLG